MEKHTCHVNVVEASAGSGKTYELARRYIRLLLNGPAAPDAQARAILAITFTNKAAVEMKERILELLKKLALGGFRGEREKKELLDFLGMEEAKARAAAYASLEAIIRNYNFFQVKTIDSFINAILSGCAFRLDLAANFRIKTDCSAHISYGLDALIDRAAADEKIRQQLLDFLHQYMFIENKAGWFPGRELLEMMTFLFFDAGAYGGRFLTEPVRRGELFSKRRVIVDLMRRLRALEPPGANQVVFKSFRSRLEKFGDSLDIAELSKPFLAEELPLKKGQEAPDETLSLWRMIRGSVGELFELESLSLFDCYIELFEQVAGELRRKASQENIMFLAEINSKGRLLFDGGITVPELYYRLAARFRHYLIDEFQDTSVLQWKNLYPMIEEALSTGGTLFYVGDTKQAIYRFRGGNASLFHRAQREFSAFGVKEENLARNWRSRREIVDFNNSVFSSQNLHRFLEEREAWEKKKDSPVLFSAADTRDILAIFAKSAQTSVPGPGGCVRIAAVNPEKGEDSDELIRERLVGLLLSLEQRRGSFRGITVLSRANLDIEKLTGWLIEAGIPVESEKTLNIREHPLVKELVALLSFLSSPIDDLSFASFILGDIFLAASGIGLEQIVSFLFRRALKRKEAGGTGSYLYRDFREQFPEAWEKLVEEAFRSIGYTPLYELVVSIYARLDVCGRFPEYQGFLMKFLETVRAQVNEENADCAAFLEFFAASAAENLYVNIADTEAVRVMSIHKAKGLESDVVVIPFLEISLESKNGRPYLIDDGEEAEEGVRLLRINRGCLPFSERLSKIFTGEYKRSLIDELNTVYVALTRAKTELYAFLPAESGKSTNLCRMLIPQELYSSGSEPPAGPVFKDTEKLILLEPASYTDWIPRLKTEFLEKSRLQNRDSLLDGAVMHQALAFIGVLTRETPEQAAKAAVERARCLFPLYEGFGEVERTVREMLSEANLRPFFYTGGRQVLCEQDICDKSGAFKRVDRIVIGDSHVTLIDYKSSSGERDSGIAQLKGYAELASAVYRRPCRTFLVYLDTVQAEETGG